jgi:hypothetical protein
VTTDSATDVTGTSATLRGELNPNGGATTYYFEYGFNATYGYTTKQKNAGSGKSSVVVIDSLTGLYPVSLYCFRLVGVNRAGLVNGTGLNFTTGSAAPTATTDSVSNVTPWSVVLNATVNPSAQLTTCVFEYGTTPSYGSTTPPLALELGIEPVRVATTLNALLPATDYHCRIVASNATGTARGADLTFSTNASATVIADSAGNITGTSAILYGHVNPNAGATTYHFEYGFTEYYGYSTKEKYAGSGKSSVLAIDTVTGLSFNTLYHYRLVGTSSAGTVHSPDLTFSTGVVSLVEGFPLAIGSGYRYAYQYENVNRDMGPIDGTMDSGYVEYHILDSASSTDSTRVWKLQESRHLLHTSMTRLMAPNPIYVSTWQDTTVKVDLVENLTRSHELQCGGLLWSFPVVVGYNGAKKIGLYRYVYETQMVLSAFWDPSGGAIVMIDTVCLEASRGMTYFSCRWGGWAMTASYGYRLAVLSDYSAGGSAIHTHEPGQFVPMKVPRSIVRPSGSRGSAPGVLRR